MVMSIAAGRSFAANTVLPDFEGREAAFRSFRTRITDGMKAGPNFNQHFSVIEIGCGTSCRFAYVGDNQTGEVFSFPYGGEEHYAMDLEYGLRSNELLVSYLDYSEYYDAREGESDTKKCVARKLGWSGTEFESIDTVKVPVDDETYFCETGSKMFRMRDALVKKNGDACHPNLTGFDVCKKARQISGELSTMLPFKMDPMTTMFGVESKGTTVTMSARWAMSVKQLRSAMATDGLGESALQERMRQSTQNIVCGNELTRAFIGLGGGIQYNYYTQDSSRIATVRVSKCH